MIKDMRNRFIYGILLLVWTVLCTLSCTRDLDDEYGYEGDGVGTVKFNIAYRPLAGAALGETRSEKGDLIGAVDNVFIAWYKENRTLAGSCYLPKEKLTITGADRDSDCETATEHADFECRIPYGSYRIYAVANMGDLTGDSRIVREADFRAIPLTWDREDIAANCQMSGYFRLDDNFKVPDADSIVRISRPNLTLHSWVRRAASKVTVAFDAAQLNENIYIYIKSARIMDIPKRCPLVDPNTPASEDELWHEGDMIRYGEGDDYTQWLRLSCGRGSNLYGNHANDAPSMFFYENMQGLHPNKHEYKNFDRKDNVPCGTYVEVTGYYVNKSAAKPSYGNIVYRCMLGRNMTDDFNAERNTHYKLTLVFNKEANDVDWHIDYDYVPKPPEIVVPSPMYISYLSNQSLNIPVTVYYDKDLISVKTLTARIVKNDWGGVNHKYYGTNTELNNGFLSLSYCDDTSVDRTNTTYYPESKTFTPSSFDDDLYRFDVPVYTRPMTLGAGFSGNNYYVGEQRHATVEVAIAIENLITHEKDTLRKDVNIIQVRRLVNPKGIWRKGDSVKPFRVNLMENALGSVSAEVEMFENVVSDGPWTARILSGEDWVRIKDTEAGNDAYGTEPVTGGTGSAVEFDFKPASTTDGVRFGQIEVRYHGNNCTHVILVSQGFGPVKMGSHRWHMSNVRYCGVDEVNPLLEGGMFKFGNHTVAFRAQNNLKEGYGFFLDAFEKPYDTYDEDGNETTHIFKDVPADINGFTSEKMSKDDGFGTSHVATYAEWTSLINRSQYTRYYGVLYGEECEKTLNRNSLVSTYTNEGEERGMKGCFICDNTTGAQLFFPIGNTGHGRRQYRDENNAWLSGGRNGVLKYATRTDEMPYSDAMRLPCLFDLWCETGAVYWYQSSHTTNDNGFDINYFTFGFESLVSQRVWAANEAHPWFNPVQDIPQSDICFIRRVYDN